MRTNVTTTTARAVPTDHIDDQSDAPAASPEPPTGAIVLDRGIPGLTTATDFTLEQLGDDDGAFQLLSATSDPAVALIVAVPWIFFPDYAPELGAADEAALGLDSPDEAIVFCPVTLDSENQVIYLNLLGPFVLNLTTRRGRQVVLADSDWPVRAPVKMDLG